MMIDSEKLIERLICKRDNRSDKIDTAGCELTENRDRGVTFGLHLAMEEIRSMENE